MSRIFVRLKPDSTALVLASCLLAVGCESPEDATRARFRERLQASAPLTHSEINPLVSDTHAAIGGRPVRIREQGAALRELDAKARAEVLAVLGGGTPVSDAGLRTADNRTLRGIEGPGTPVRSELEAAQTLWIDIDTILPRRFELTNRLPGFGDYAYDIVW
jgi:hypothetical protein